MRIASVILLLTILTAPSLHSQGWEWQNPRPHGETVNDMVMVDAARGVAVCNNGYYLYTADGGRSWTTYRLGHANLERIIEARDGSLVLLTDRQRIYRSTDMAYSWQEVHTIVGGNRLGVFELHMTPDGTLVAVVNGPYYYQSRDNGVTWTRFADNNIQISNETPRALSVQSNTVWYLLGNWGLYKTTDAGDNWEMILDRDQSRQHQRYVFVDSLYGYELREGQLLRTHDGGATWVEMDIYGFGTLRDLEAGGALGDAVFALSLGRYLLNASSDGGEHWNISLTESAFVDAYPYVIEFVDASTGFIAGDGGRILRTEDGGQSWSIVHGIGYIGTITDVIFTDDDHGIATTYSSTVLLTTNGGRRWDNAIPSSDHACDAIAASPDGTLFLVATTHSYDFDLFVSTDHGRSWELRSRLPLQYTSSNPEMAQRILAISDNDILVGATYGLLLRSTDGGRSWDRRTVQSSQTSQFSSGTALFHFPPATFIYLQSNGLQYSTDGGNTWEGRLTPRARTLWEAQFVTPDVGYGLISGEFARTTDGGKNWDVTSDFTPQLLHFFDERNGMVLWSDPMQDDLTFVMTTTDGGASWTKHSMGERAAYSGWFFRAPSRVWGYGYGGAIRSNEFGGIVGMPVTEARPASLLLDSGYPNPFSMTSHATFHLPFTARAGGSVRLHLYDLLGRRLRVLSASDVGSGAQELRLPADAFHGIAPGTYPFRLQVGTEIHTGRLQLR
ncbi:MAG: YCF48-related protein [Bacteroidota bacterium]|jgi:photosystem II stability/assembly factor-like uncharacterized protein|nr:YCF48-related protein [Bacteroidota bacterium]